MENNNREHIINPAYNFGLPRRRPPAGINWILLVRPTGTSECCIEHSGGYL